MKAFSLLLPGRSTIDPELSDAVFRAGEGDYTLVKRGSYVFVVGSWYGKKADRDIAVNEARERLAAEGIEIGNVYFTG